MQSYNRGHKILIQYKSLVLEIEAFTATLQKSQNTNTVPWTFSVEQHHKLDTWPYHKGEKSSNHNNNTLRRSHYHITCSWCCGVEFMVVRSSNITSSRIFLDLILILFVRVQLKVIKKLIFFFIHQKLNKNFYYTFHNYYLFISHAFHGILYYSFGKVISSFVQVLSEIGMILVQHVIKLRM